MASRKKAAPRRKAADSADVPTFLKNLKHARKDEVERVRTLVLESDPTLTERVKWNAPSFGNGEDDRITFRLQPGDRVQLVFHRGAKVVADAATFTFKDVSGLIQWASSDRGIVTFESRSDIDRSEGKLRTLVRAWLKATR